MQGEKGIADYFLAFFKILKIVVVFYAIWANGKIKSENLQA